MIRPPLHSAAICTPIVVGMICGACIAHLRTWHMFTALIALATTHAAGLIAGAGAGTALELIVPALTAAHRVRKAVNVARTISRAVHNRDLTPQEIMQIRFDSTLTK